MKQQHDDAAMSSHRTRTNTRAHDERIAEADAVEMTSARSIRAEGGHIAAITMHDDTVILGLDVNTPTQHGDTDMPPRDDEVTR